MSTPQPVSLPDWLMTGGMVVGGEWGFCAQIRQQERRLAPL